jgi:hypothetical protein
VRLVLLAGPLAGYKGQVLTKAALNIPDDPVYLVGGSAEYHPKQGDQSGQFNVIRPEVHPVGFVPAAQAGKVKMRLVIGRRVQAGFISWAKNILACAWRGSCLLCGPGNSSLKAWRCLNELDHSLSWFLAMVQIILASVLFGAGPAFWANAMATRFMWRELAYRKSLSTAPACFGQTVQAVQAAGSGFITPHS